MRKQSEGQSDNQIKQEFPYRLAKSKRLVHVPTTFQIEACECGAASLSMVLKYYRLNIPMEQIRLECNVSRDGCNAADIVRAAQGYGLITKGYRKSAEDLRNLSYPCILHWNFNHFVVLEGIKADKVYINNPECGPKVISFKELEAAYTGVVICLKPGENFVAKNENKGLSRIIFDRLVMDIGSVVFMLIVGLLLVFPGMMLSVMTQMFIDYVLLRGSSFWLYKILTLMVFIYGFKLLFTWLRQSVLTKYKLKLTMVTGYKLFGHMLKLPVSFFEQRYVGELSTRIDNNNEVNAFLAGNFSSALLDVFEAVFYLILLIAYNPVLASVGVTGIVINIIVSMMIIKPIANLNLKLQQDMGHLNARITAGFSVISAIKASGIENEYASDMIGNYANTTATDQRLGMISQILSSFPSMITNISNLAVMIVGGTFIMRGDMSTGTLAGFTMLLGFLNAPVNNLIGLNKGIQDMKAGMARVEDIESAKIDNRYLDDNKNKDRSLLSGQMEVRNLTFGYNKGLEPVVNKFSMRITPGTKVAIVGESGCGKSTIAKLITGLLEPWDGSVLFDGESISNIPREYLNEGIAVVSQNHMIFSGSVRDNLTLFDKECDEKQLERAIEDADAKGFIYGLAGGLDHYLNESGSNISGGQRQKIEIARALYKNPAILIMDEATSALDAISEMTIMQNIRKRRCTCIIIAHRLSSIRDCDMIIVMKNGQIAECGTHEVLMKKNGVYAALVE